MRKRLNEEQTKKFKEMMECAVSYKNHDKDLYKKFRGEAKKYKKKCINKNWIKHKESTILLNRFHKLSNGMVKNGKMLVNGCNLNEMKQKQPSIALSVEDTCNKWHKFMSDKFSGDNDSSND